MFIINNISYVKVYNVHHSICTNIFISTIFDSIYNVNTGNIYVQYNNVFPIKHIRIYLKCNNNEKFIRVKLYDPIEDVLLISYNDINGSVVYITKHMVNVTKNISVVI